MKPNNLFLVAIILLLFYMIAYEPNAYQVKTYSIQDSQLDGIRIAYLSDLHLKQNDYKKVDKIVKLVQQQSPDVILIGGDIVAASSKNRIFSMNVFAKKLQIMGAPIVAVLGDSDYKSTNKNKISNDLTLNGVHVLENSKHRIFKKRRYIDIIGLADMQTGVLDTSKAFKNTYSPKIVLTHHPDAYYDILEKVNLILAGHTHGGQIIIPFSPPLFVASRFGAEFASGLIQKNQNKMIISKGLGTSGPPMRLNCKPEIVIVNFTK